MRNFVNNTTFIVLTSKLMRNLTHYPSACKHLTRNQMPRAIVECIQHNESYQAVLVNLVSAMELIVHKDGNNVYDSIAQLHVDALIKQICRTHSKNKDLVAAGKKLLGQYNWIKSEREKVLHKDKGYKDKLADLLTGAQKDIVRTPCMIKMYSMAATKGKPRRLEIDHALTILCIIDPNGKKSPKRFQLSKMLSVTPGATTEAHNKFKANGNKSLAFEAEVSGGKRGIVAIEFDDQTDYDGWFRVLQSIVGFYQGRRTRGFSTS